MQPAAHIWLTIFHQSDAADTIFCVLHLDHSEYSPNGRLSGVNQGGQTSCLPVACSVKLNRNASKTHCNCTAFMLCFPVSTH